METHRTIEDALDSDPLIIFSVYTHSQSTLLRRLGNEILACFDAGFSVEGDECYIADDVIGRGYGQFWLWVLGAYEVVRTMCQAKTCFSPRLADELTSLKVTLAALRMPFAKQELPGTKRTRPVCAEPSIHGFSHSPPDFRFEVKGRVVSARELINEFERVFNAITRADMLADHRESYAS